MAQRRESFLLNKSQEFTLATGAENRTDITLTPNPVVDFGAITGTVTTGTTPVFNALVKVLTPGGSPIDHVYTNETGQYVTDSLPSGTYQLVASAPGFLTSAPVTVNLPAVSVEFVDFSLTPDPRAALNSLYGLVLEQMSEARLPDATVILTDTQGQTVATTTTNSDGQYLLCEIENGSYLISATKEGFELSIPLAVTVTGSQFSRTNIILTPEVPVQGTVQGFIRDQNNMLLAGACVGLYLVTDSTETLVQTTFTNGNGFYLFGDVAAGNYVVKAKLDVLF